MSTQLQLHATVRKDQGKGASRRLRRAGQIPAIIYGGQQSTILLSLNAFELDKVLEQEHFFSSTVNIDLEGETHVTVVQDMQRHPYKPTILHLDFLRVSEAVQLTMRVPLHFENDEKCPGVKMSGGLLSYVAREVEISCYPKQLPRFIAVDLSELKAGQAVRLSELKLPEGVTIPSLGLSAGFDQPVVTCKAKGGDEEEQPTAEEAPAESSSE